MLNRKIVHVDIVNHMSLCDFELMSLEQDILRIDNYYDYPKYYRIELLFTHVQYIACPTFFQDYQFQVVSDPAHPLICEHSGGMLYKFTKLYTLPGETAEEFFIIARKLEMTIYYEEGSEEEILKDIEKFDSEPSPETSGISREALFAIVDQVSKEPTPPLEVVDFHNMGDIQVIEFYRASRSDYRDAGHFWIKVFQYEIERFSPLPAFEPGLLSYQVTLCKEISLETLTEEINKHDFLVNREHDFALRGQFQRAWIMWESDMDIALLAMTDREFVAFFWTLTD